MTDPRASYVLPKMTDKVYLLVAGAAAGVEDVLAEPESALPELALDDVFALELPDESDDALLVAPPEPEFESLAAAFEPLPSPEAFAVALLFAEP